MNGVKSPRSINPWNLRSPRKVERHCHLFLQQSKDIKIRFSWNRPWQGWLLREICWPLPDWTLRHQSRLLIWIERPKLTGLGYALFNCWSWLSGAWSHANRKEIQAASGFLLVIAQATQKTLVENGDAILIDLGKWKKVAYQQTIHRLQVSLHWLHTSITTDNWKCTGGANKQVSLGLNKNMHRWVNTVAHTSGLSGERGFFMSTEIWIYHSYHLKTHRPYRE